YLSSYRLQSASQLLFPFDGLEESLEVPFAEALGTMALDDLEEQRRTILNGLGEDLEHVTFVVPVNQDAQVGQHLNVLVDLPHPVRKQLIVSVGNSQERDIVRPHGPYCLHDVVCGHRDVLDSGAAVELQIFLDLPPATALGRLIDGELDAPVSAGDHLGHE